MTMTHTWDCSCGHSTSCQPEDQRTGAVYRCQGCMVVWGAVQPKQGGGPKWVPIADDLVKFHDLLGEQHAIYQAEDAVIDPDSREEIPV